MTQIQTNLRLKLLVAGEAELPVPAEFIYDTTRPLAVQATFHAAGDTVDWIFARELLDAGLSGDVGLGDVRMWPSRTWDDVDQVEVNVIYISLNSPEGQAILEAEAAVIKKFLDETYELCPSGTEVIDMDAMLAELLS